MLGILATLIPALIPVLSKFIPDPTQQAQAQAELIKVLTENQSAVMNSMADVMKADAQSEGWMTRNARPTVVYWCLGMITLWFIFSLFGYGETLSVAFKGVPSQLWDLATYGIGAYILGKSGVDISKAIAKK